MKKLLCIAAFTSLTLFPMICFGQQATPWMRVTYSPLSHGDGLYYETFDPVPFGTVQSGTGVGSDASMIVSYSRTWSRGGNAYINHTFGLMGYAKGSTTIAGATARSSVQCATCYASGTVSGINGTYEDAPVVGFSVGQLYFWTQTASLDMKVTRGYLSFSRMTTNN